MKVPKRRSISFWYYALGLGLIATLVWFFLEVVAAPKAEKITKIAKEMLEKPLENGFNQTAIDSIEKRQVLFDIDLSNSTPYTQNTGASQDVDNEGGLDSEGSEGESFIVESNGEGSIATGSSSLEATPSAIFEDNEVERE